VACERVFRAWTTPDELRGWWRITPEHTTPIAEVDLRLGGAYRLGMTGPSGTNYVVTGVFHEIEVPRRLVYSWRWIAPEPSPESLVTVEFHPRGTATEIVIVHAGLRDETSPNAHHAGWQGCLDSLVRSTAGAV